MVGRLEGAINILWRVHCHATDGHWLLRVRAREAHFPYEKGLVKEAWLARFLAGEPLPPPVSGPLPPFPPLPTIRHYDHSGTLIAGAFSIIPEIPGAPLATLPDPALYGHLGRLLARLHATRWPGFYATVTDLPDAPLPNWRDRFAASLQGAAMPEDAEIEAALKAWPLPDGATARPTLIHNDLHARNIWVEAPSQRLHLLDWDNAVIDIPELDWVKLAWWTRVDDAGLLCPDPALYQAALDAYHAAGGPTLDPTLLNACTILWLLRVVRFQTRSGGAPAGFPAAAAYRAELLRRLRRPPP